ncbi:MAG: septation protein IspZ, partial [Novosphingobium sp.]
MTASPPPDPCATPSTGEPAPTPKPRKSGWLNLAVDYGPIVLFFVIYRYYSPGDDKNMIAEISAVVRSTIGFMVAAVIALIVSKTRLGHVSPMLWLSTALIVFFGGLTVWAQDQLYIQLKPTVIYLFF